MVTIAVVLALATPAVPAIGGSRLEMTQPALQEAFVEKLPNSTVSFRMLPLPEGEITVSGQATKIKGLWIAETETTWDLYDIYAFQLDAPSAPGEAAPLSSPSRPYGAPDRGFGHAGFPAIGIHINAAKQFCKWLSERTGKTYRLPTEAEWEYAARAGATSLPEKMEDAAWFWENAEDQTQAVKAKQPNAWGLHDMLGNATEWTIGLDGEPVCRGGSFKDKREKVGFDLRQPYDPNWQAADAHTPKSQWWLSDGPHVGFRVVCEKTE